MIRKQLKNNFHILFIYTLLAFPLFYFIYKFGILLGGYDDANSYLKLYSDLTSKEVPSPFNMRLLSAAIIKIMSSTGLYYNTQCSIDSFPEVNKLLFFNNIFFNFICITITSYSIFVIFVQLGYSKILSFLMGNVYLLGFGTLFFLMMPGPDSLSVLLFTWLMYHYVQKNPYIFLFFILLIFQREYYFLVFILVSILDYFKYEKNKYYLYVFLLSLVSFLIYYILRKTIFHTEHWSQQTSPSFLISSLLDINIELIPMFKQTIMTMNLYLIYIFVLLYKWQKKMEINKHYLITSLLILAQITLLSFAAKFGNNNGRYFYLITPLLLYYLINELTPLLKEK